MKLMRTTQASLAPLRNDIQLDYQLPAVEKIVVFSCGKLGSSKWQQAYDSVKINLFHYLYEAQFQ